MTTNPLRKAGLFSTEVDGQTLIYDSTSQQTHCLNPQAWQVWALCDGRHSRNAMARALTADLQSGDAEDLVDAALDRFATLGMLDDGTLPTRRAVGKTAARALAAGLVLSVLVPTRAMAGSVLCETLDEEQCAAEPGCVWVGIGTCTSADI